MNGGNLLVLPASSSPEVQNKFLQKIQAPRYDKRDTNTVIAHIETQAALFRDAFEQPDIKTILPQIRQYYRLILPAHTEILLSDKHSAPLLVSRHYGKGNLYLSAFTFCPPTVIWYFILCSYHFWSTWLFRSIPVFIPPTF